MGMKRHRCQRCEGNHKTRAHDKQAAANGHGRRAAAGALEILNVGGGHRTVTFNPDDEAERERVAAMITDMLKRGTAIFVEIGGSHVRVKRFLAEFHAYLIDEPEEPAASAAAAAVGRAGVLCKCGRPARHRGRHLKPGKTKPVAVAVEKTRAVAVARSAGG